MSSVGVRVFVACEPLTGFPIFSSQSVPCVDGTQGQIAAIFDAIADVASSGCIPIGEEGEGNDICDAQCIKDIQEKAKKILEELETKQITVPVVVGCLPDGEPDLTSVQISVPKSQAAAITQQFQQIAKLRTQACKAGYLANRNYQILGGDNWYVDKSALKPTRNDFFDQRFKEIAFKAFDSSKGYQERQQTSPNLVDWIINALGSVYFRTGIHDLPVDAVETLLTYSDSEEKIKIHTQTEYLNYLIKQLDLLMGEFPIQIEIEDIDPLKPGNQTKKIELPNVSETLAETYALAISASTNADLAINFLMRLASEVIATKNATIITQDYAKANAMFLGYKGNPKNREVDYSFNPAKLNSLGEFLQNAKGNVTGWVEDDNESVVGFLQRIVFSAGIIKAVFMRDQKRLDELSKELLAMLNDTTTDDEAWRTFIQRINDPNSQFNIGVNDGEFPLSTLDNKPVNPLEKPKDDKK